MISSILKKNKNVFYVLTGNFLEYFDLFMYVHLAHIIHKYYFLDAKSPLLNAFTLANLYLFAPIGCIVFAYLGDTIGRKKIIVSTSIIMAFCSSTIGFLPTYQDIGPIAGVLLIALRILQGISLSGEPVAALVYLIESTPYRYGPLVMTLRSATEIFAAVLALGIGYITIDFLGERVGWRVPFYLSTVFCFFSLWLRWHLAESKEYLKYTSENKVLFEERKKTTLFEFYRSLDFKHPNLLCLFGLSVTTGLVFVVSYVYLGKFLIKDLGLTEHDLLLHNLKLGLCEMASSLLVGFLVIHWNLNVKKFLLWRTGVLLCILPFFMSLLKTSPSIATVFMMQFIFNTCLDKTLIYVSLIKVFSVMGRFSLVGIVMSFAKLSSFFMSSIVFSYVFYSYNIMWLVGLMFPLALIFFFSLIFYVPYDKLTARTFKTRSQIEEKLAA